MKLLPKLTLALALATLSINQAEARKYLFKMADYGIVPGNRADHRLASRLDSVLQVLKAQTKSTDRVVLQFAEGRYDFHAADAPAHEIYVSNHDQNQPKHIGLFINKWDNVTIDGGGAEFICHGRMLPLAVMNAANTQIKNLHIDFENPHIIQVQVVKNSPEEGITFEAAPWVKCRISAKGNFEAYGEGWSEQPFVGIAFERDTRHMVYRTSDIEINTSGVKSLGGSHFLAPHWKDSRLIPGTVVAMRTYFRPCPGIFLANNHNTDVYNVKVHYAEGMGLIAQRCNNIRLNKFGVCLRGDNDLRYFTTQADATHFSQCKGKIVSNNGLYEGMMDDAINIHGIYLKVRERIDNHTLRCAYEHEQAWGFEWGDAGDVVSFVRAASMDDLGVTNEIASIRPADGADVKGCKEFVISFKNPLPAEISEKEGYGLENLTWTPEVEFRRNVVRNNRARGALFSSPRRTVCTDNLFDHTSGTAILLCGDCNGWYESGAVRNLIIRRNTFINALTNMFQFTNAVISIYPEIPKLEAQRTYFHGGKPGAIRIEDNDFVTFDTPLLYAKSVNGLVFRKNRVRKSTDYQPFHWNQKAILLEHCQNAEVEEAEHR